MAQAADSLYSPPGYDAPTTLPPPNPVTRNPDGTLSVDRGKAVAAISYLLKQGAAWTSKRKRGITNMPSNLVKETLGIGPGTSALVGAAARSVPDIVRAAFDDKEAAMRVGAGAIAVAKSLKDQAVAAVKDPYGAITENPLTFLTLGEGAAKVAAGAVGKGAAAVGEAVGKRQAAVAMGAAPKIGNEMQVLQGVKEASQSLGKPAAAVAKEGIAKPVAKALDRTLEAKSETYAGIRANQRAEAATSKVLNRARVDEQIARNNDMKDQFRQFGDLTDAEHQELAERQLSIPRYGAPETDRVSLALGAWKNLNAHVQHEWQKMGRDLGPLEAIPRYQPARVEEIGTTFPKVLRDLGAEAPPAPSTAIEGEIANVAKKRGFLTRASNQLREHLTPKDIDPQWPTNNPGIDDPIEAKFKVARNGKKALPREVMARMIERDPEVRRKLGTYVEGRLQRERSSKVPGSLQVKMPKIGDQPGMLPKAPGQRSVYQLTREEFDAMPPERAARTMQRFDPEGELSPDELYDRVIEHAVANRKVVPLEVLEQNDAWFDDALSKPNQRLMAATEEVKDAIAKRGSSQPLYIPMLRENRPLSVLAKRTRGGQKPGSPFKQRMGATYGSGEWVKNPRVLAQKMTGQLRAYQRAQQIHDGVMAEIAAKKIPGRLIQSVDDLRPGEVAWTPDGLKLWSKEIDFGKRFVGELQTFGASEEGAARALAKAMSSSIGDGVFTAVEQGTVKPKVYAIPEGVSKMLNAEFKEAPAWVRYLVDKPTNAWRFAVLSLRPAWVANNIIGNVIFSTLNGVAPRHYLMALQEQFRAKTPDNLNGVRLTAQESNLGLTASTGGPLAQHFEWLDAKPTPIGAIDHAPGFGEALRTEGEKIASVKAVVSRIGKAVNDVNSHVESFYRSANFLKEAEKLARKKLVLQTGKSAAEAAAVLDEMDRFTPGELDKIVAKVNYFMNDYSSLTPWERSVVRRVIPFYSFMKHQTRLLLHLPIDYPGRAAMLQATVAIGKEMQAEDNAHLPDWARDKGYVDTNVEFDLDGRKVRAFVTTGGANPFMVGYGPAGNTDPGSDDFGIPEALKLGYQAAGPVARVAGDQLADRGYALIGHRSMRAPNLIEKDGKWYDATTRQEAAPPYTDPVSDYVAQFPQVQTARKVINPRSGYPGRPLSLETYRKQATTTPLIQLLKYFSPVSIILVDQSDTRRVYSLSRQDRKALIRAAGRERELREMDRDSWWNLGGRGGHTEVPKPGTAPADSVRQQQQ